ncbi:MAG: Lrp/AsnC family transcriptional regulator [Christensenellales bacterium]|jgi:Lrp/AsnC family leucine-responsive transcriptional regulator
MDALDIAILNILKSNARASFLSIGKAINLSTSAVVERVKKLERSGVISGYTAIINGKSFDKQLTALVFVSLESPRYIDGFVDFICKNNDVIECHSVTGNYDFILKIVTENPLSLEKLLNKIKSETGVIKTYTYVTLDTIKNEYSVAPQL